MYFLILKKLQPLIFVSTDYPFLPESGVAFAGFAAVCADILHTAPTKVGSSYHTEEHIRASHEGSQFFQ